MDMSRTLKKFHAPAEDRTGDPSISSRALYHVAIKAGVYRKAVQVYDTPNLYPVTLSPSILNSSSNSQKYKNHMKPDLRSSNAYVGFFPLGAICHGLLKTFHALAEDRTGDPSISSRALYHVAIKASLYRKVVQVYDIPNLYPVTDIDTIITTYNTTMTDAAS